MHIGILQTGHAPDPIQAENGDYDDMFHRLLDGHGLRFTTWNVVDMDFPSGPQAADGWLITGSRHSAYEDHPWIPPLEDLIRAIHAGGQPLLGICFGHQIIAQALGGQVEKFAGGWSVGRQVYEIEGQPTALNAWHQDQVVDLPPGARVIGSSGFCANAALAIGDHVLTYQPHPEFDAGVVKGLIESRGPGIVPDDLLSIATAQLDAPLDRDRIARRMVDFLKGKVPA